MEVSYFIQKEIDPKMLRFSAAHLWYLKVQIFSIISRGASVLSDMLSGV